MKIIICLKEVVDTRLNLDFGLTNRVVFNEGLPLRLNPNDAAAFNMALALKQSHIGSPVEITLISIGTTRVESYLRDGLAAGADRAIRLWEEDCSGLSSFQKARLLTHAITLSGADLVFTGASSPDTGNSLVGPLIAAWLDLPCICQAVSLELSDGGNVITAVRDIGRGAREKLRCSLPAVVTVKGELKLPYASLDNIIACQSAGVTVLSATDLGITPLELKTDPTRIISLSFPRPRTKKVVTLDSSLPAFDRILKLLEGGISRRQGKLLQGSEAEMADQLYDFLLAEGIIAPPDK
jgi:electron transfer flavoprotein beta subunit